MHRLIAIIILFTCTCIDLQAQVNFVRNPGLEEYSQCPTDWNQVFYCKNWNNAIDSDFTWGMEYYNSCAESNTYAGLPSNGGFYQNAHSGNGMAGFHLFYDKTTPFPPSVLPRNYRDYLQGHLYHNLEAGKEYCVSFYVNMAEASGYAHDKIGAYLDDGSFDDTVSVAGSEMTFVMPQIFTTKLIDDTLNWVKVEGSFIAKGNENYITIGNFFKNEDLTTLITNYWSVFDQYSYYLIDDISVIPLDLPADAGEDSWVHKGDSILIGRWNDTTAQSLDCKWYHKGSLIDSGAAIWAKGYGMVGDRDTYTVVQTICGLVKTDTVVVYTASVDIKEIGKDQQLSVFPNPSDGRINIRAAKPPPGRTQAKIYDPSGRLLDTRELVFKANTASMQIAALPGVYILELTDAAGDRQRLQLLLQ